MFSVSDTALQILKDTLETTRTDEAQVLRLETRDNEFLLGLGESQDGDIRFESEGALVLAAAEDVAGLFDNATIDVETVDGEARLFLAS